MRFDFDELSRVAIADCRLGLLIGTAVLIAGCLSSSRGPATVPTTRPAPSAQEVEAWSEIAAGLGKSGVERDGVYTVTFPRDDLFVSIEGMDVPTAAGIESVFRFYQCSCGKTVGIGHFVLADYEANDVIYALEKEDFVVSAIAPFLLYDKPRLLEVRFQAEGHPRRLAQALRRALDWTGKNRLKSQKVD